MKIPRIIHQTWKNDRVPAPMQQLAQTWRQFHPDWEYRLWTDEQNREFIRSQHPRFLAHYDAYPHHIQRVDAVRYFILLTSGGLYVDLDFECLKACGPLLAGHDCLFGLEPEEHCRIHGKDKIISNAFMATIPSHPFFHAVVHDLITYKSDNPNRNDRILETTGPFMLGRVHKDCHQDVTLIPSEFLYPLSIFEIEQLAANGWNDNRRKKLQRAYGVHYHAGTWWRG